MPRALTTVAVVAAAVAVGLGVTVALHQRSTAGGRQPGQDGGPNGSTATTAAFEIVPGPGQSFLTGTTTAVTADNAIGQPLKPPFTITIASRGQGNADITGVSVAGQDVQIFWYGGQPLPVSGTGQLAIDGGGLSVDASGITWMLDGAPRSLTAGHFNLGAPVAVGSGGLAQPHQSIAFEAGDRSTVQTSGHAQVHLPPATIHVTGPGRVTVRGDLQLQTTNGTQHVASVVFGPGSYAIDLTPTTAGDTIRATLQGPVTPG